MSKNPIRTKSKTSYQFKIRHLIQTLFFLITCSLGIRFYFFVQQAGSSGPLSIARPAGVEGFLPIGALLAWKRFLLTGEWDPVHPAAMVLFGFALLLSLIFRKAFCSWICPVGTLSEWVWKTGRRLFNISLKLPKWLDILLRSIKYLLLGFFLWVVGVMSIGAITLFIEGPYYKISDVKMLRFFTQMSLTTAVVLVILTIISLFIKNFWCRYLCPYGALTGLFGALGPSHISRNIETCIKCGKCTDVCPHQIKVDQKSIILSPECSACLDCVDSCPVQQTLAFKTGVARRQITWAPRSVGILILVGFILTIAIAMTLGIWDTNLPEQELRKLIKLIDSPILTHPTI